jgi:hypothetical protein
VNARPALVALLLAACGPGSDPPGVDPTPPDAEVTPDAIPPDAVVTTVGPEVDGVVTINEVMAANAMTVPDGGDWVELYNPGDVELDLHGYGLTDDLTMPNKALLPGGSVIAPHGYLLVVPETLGFQLSKEPAALGLSRPDGTWIDRIQYGAQEVDFSVGRQPDGSNLWVVSWHPTPGAPAPDTGGQPMGLEDPSAPPEPAPGAGDLSVHLLGYDEMPHFELSVSSGGIAALLAQPFEYVPASIVFQGRSYGPVGLRLKGSNSFEPITAKPSFRINVDEYVAGARFWGLKDLTLNNMDNDFSMMHERIAYWVARQVGVPASRANHATVSVNGQSYGLYTNVETVKHVFLQRNFADPEGSLFEATDVDFVVEDVADYDLESGPNDRSHILGVAQALTQPSADAAISAAGAHADIAQLRRYMAMCAVIGQFDSFPYSIPGDDYFVYADPTIGKLVFMPWGMDETFYSGDVDVNNVHSVLAVACKESAACWQAWRDEVWEVLAEVEQLGWVAEVDRVRAQIASRVAADTRKPYTAEEVQTYQQGMHWFTTNRRSQLEGMLQTP